MNMYDVQSTLIEYNNAHRGVHSANQRTIRDFLCMLRKSKIKYKMYSTIKKFLSVSLARRNFLQSGRGLRIIATRGDMHVFC